MDDVAAPCEPAGNSVPNTHLASHPVLTPREAEVAALLKEGATDKAIAHALGMASSTAKVHVKRIREKLGVPNRSTAAAALLRAGAPSAAVVAMEREACAAICDRWATSGLPIAIHIAREIRDRSRGQAQS